MIVTVTPNPSLDRTFEVDRLTRGEVIRPVAAHVEPGGKGINVSRALLANGHPTRAVVPLGGSEGDHLESLLAALDLPVLPVGLGAAVRTNVSLVEPDGTVTKVNAPGPLLDGGEVEALRKATIGAAEGADWVALCGSLPPGAPESLYAILVRDLRAAGVRTAVDTSGAPLASAVAARPHLVKPNRDELTELAGRDLDTLADVLAAAET
ncbi:MAG: 1-phosphofructokinase family hexose kinase, partial [Nitriliruptorales bacterium]